LAAASVVKLHWWTRLGRKFRRNNLRAGERPWEEQGGKKKKPKKAGSGSVFRTLRRLISALLILGGILYGVYDPFRDWVNDKWTSAKDTVMDVVQPSYNNVTAAPGTLANTDVPADPACPPLAADPLLCRNGVSAVDGFKNTYWLTTAPSPGSPVQPTLDVALAEPTDIDRIIVHNGAFDNFQGFARPKTLLFVFDNGQQDEVELKNTPEEQKLEVDNGGNVSRFQIIVTEVYTSIENPAQMAITEIEFATKE
jgi:hypothetical protein